MNRRRRVVRQRPELFSKMKRLKDLRCDVRRTIQDLQRSYDVGCKRVWKFDTDVAEYRKLLSQLRRRELRLARQLASDLESVIGPEPE